MGLRAYIYWRVRVPLKGLVEIGAYLVQGRSGCNESRNKRKKTWKMAWTVGLCRYLSGLECRNW